jgi:hypothetical protein
MFVPLGLYREGCAHTLRVAATRAAKPISAGASTRMILIVLESMVGTVFLRAVEALERLPDVV